MNGPYRVYVRDPDSNTGWQPYTRALLDKNNARDIYKHATQQNRSVDWKLTGANMHVVLEWQMATE